MWSAPYPFDNVLFGRAAGQVVATRTASLERAKLRGSIRPQYTPEAARAQHFRQI